MSNSRILEVAVFAPLRSTFDYLCPPALTSDVRTGARVLVPFGHSQRLGIIIAIRSDSLVPRSRLKPISELLDLDPLIDDTLFELAGWVSEYYHYPLGEVFEMLLPTKLRRAHTKMLSAPVEFIVTAEGRAAFEDHRVRGLRQTEVLRLGLGSPLTVEGLRHLGFDAQRIARQLVTRGWLTEQPRSAPQHLNIPATPFLALNRQQSSSYAAIRQASSSYHAHLLQGVTGSGKTEIYLHLIRDVVSAGRQALVLVPEIGLTEQLVMRFRERFGSAVTVVHSGLTENARATAWQACRDNLAKILLGTRSAVWMPLPTLSLIVVDEEHDLSYKQQEGLRYSARDVAVMRARRAEIPIVLGSATPSLESLANCERGKYTHLEISERAGDAAMPIIKLVDIRGLPLTAGMSEPLRQELNATLARGDQALVFLNRRGFAPIVLCHHCGWIASCERCDARLVLHRRAGQLRCHHCSATRPLTFSFAGHACGALSDYVDLGIGTEQIEETLTDWFPSRQIVRIDRDSMPHRGQLEAALEQVRNKEIDILVGTQMIAKGHDFAGVTLVGILDADSRLHANDFRADERFIQLVLQVAGRAGRAEREGLVLIQTHHPHHPIFEFIISGRYKEFAQSALRERAAAELPPYRALALLRAEAINRAVPMRFLQAMATRVRQQAPSGVSIEGPIPALMEKRVGKFRANLLLLAPDRNLLSLTIRALLNAIDKSPLTKRVRWSLDIDAQELI
jgi:primosomal protein N' (replication factor Y) (superfamily II helicase)